MQVGIHSWYRTSALGTRPPPGGRCSICGGSDILARRRTDARSHRPFLLSRDAHEPPGEARTGRWHCLHRPRLWGRRRSGRRGLLQHVDDRLPGDPDRSQLSRSDPDDDLPADRQLRRERRRRREPWRAPGRLCGSRAEPPSEQLPQRRRPGHLPEPLQRVGARGDRHPGAGPQATDAGRHAGCTVFARPGRCQSGGQSPSQPRSSGTRSGARSAAHFGLQLGRGTQRLVADGGHRQAGGIGRSPACGRAGLRHEIEHRPASVRYGLPRDHLARYRYGRRSTGAKNPMACFFPTALAIRSR